MEETWEFAAVSWRVKEKFLQTLMLVAFASLVGCAKGTISVQSADRYLSSMEKVQSKLDDDKRIEFIKSAQGLVLNHEYDEGYNVTRFTKLDLERMSIDEILPYYSDLFDSMTAEDIILKNKILTLHPSYRELDAFDELVIKIEGEIVKFGPDYILKHKGDSADLATALANVKDLIIRRDLTYKILKIDSNDQN